MYLALDSALAVRLYSLMISTHMCSGHGTHLGTMSSSPSESPYCSLYQFFLPDIYNVFRTEKVNNNNCCNGKT